MKVDIKKDIVNAVDEARIDILNPEEINLLRENDTYNRYLNTLSVQSSATSSSIVKAVISGGIGILSLGICILETILSKKKTNENKDYVELLVNEAKADNIVNTEESK